MKDVEKKVEVAKCPFCGQMVTVLEQTEDLTEYAKLHCRCSMAQNYADRVARTERVKEIVEWRCKGKDGIKEVLLAALPTLFRGSYKSIVIKANDDIVYSLSDRDGIIHYKDKEQTEYEEDI